MISQYQGEGVRPTKVRVDTSQGLPSNDTVEDSEAHHGYEVEYTWEESSVVSKGISGDDHLTHPQFWSPCTSTRIIVGTER